MVIQMPAEPAGPGLSAAALKAMADIGRAHGLASLIAPVRPSWKERYPLTPIERYAEWRREDGLLFDPWLRVHERAGASILRDRARVASHHRHGRRVGGMGRDAVPGGRRLRVPRRSRAADGRGDTGRYWEPNVWMRHPLARAATAVASASDDRRSDSARRRERATDRGARRRHRVATNRSREPPPRRALRARLAAPAAR